MAGVVTGVDEANTTRASPLPNPFLPSMTALYAIAWVIVMVQGWGAHIGSDPIGWLYDPGSTAARIVVRDLELAEVLDGEGSLFEYRRNWYGAPEQTREYAVSMQRDAVHEVRRRFADGYETREQLVRSELRLAVLLAETGNPEEAYETITASENPDVIAAFHQIYGEAEHTGRPSAEPLERLAEHGLEDWHLERAAVHLLENSEAHDDALKIAKDIERRGRKWLRRVDAMNMANLLLIATGAVVFVIALRSRAPASEGLEPPWSMELGIGVMVRADFWNRLYFVVLAHAGDTLDDPSWLAPFYTWGTLLASLPMLWLVWRYLVPRQARTGAIDLSFFGVSRERAAPLTLAAVALAALAIDLLGTTAIGWASYSYGFEGHWAEGLDETLIWGSTREVVETALDYLVWTPLFEELFFRGLVYATLRTRYGTVASALASASFFSAIHFYSFSGFLMTFWSGFVWAFAFERARSLMPGVIAHSIYNLFFVLGTVLVYR